MENKAFSFLNPVWNLFDSGLFFREPFRILYVVLGILNLILPIAYLVVLVNGKFFKYASGGAVVAAILVLLVLAAAAWCSFVFWWNRKDKLKEQTKEGDEFVAIPVISHLIQSMGEQIGLYTAVVGAVVSFIATLFAANEGLDFLTSYGLWGIIVYPIYGFFIIVFARLMAELYRALAAIANNTKKLK